MSSMPYAMQMVKREKQRQSKMLLNPEEGFRNSQRNYNESPNTYSSKMMNSIWGMYNKYSVHNFKSKLCDEETQQSGSTQMSAPMTASVASTGMGRSSAGLHSVATGLAHTLTRLL